VIDLLPGFLRLVPATGKLRTRRTTCFCFVLLRRTPANIRAMLLYALREYVPDERLRKALKSKHLSDCRPWRFIILMRRTFSKTFEKYQRWYLARNKKSERPRPRLSLDPGENDRTALMRPQVVKQNYRHYDALIRAIEAQGMSVIPQRPR